MEHRSQKANRIVSLFVALLAIASARGAELSYEVRHHRALKDHAGVLTINEKGVSYQQALPEGKRKKPPKKPPKLESVQFDYQDIQELRVSPDKLVLVTYKDRKWLLGIDKEFEFYLPQGKSFEAAYTMLKDKLDRRFVAAVAEPQPGLLWELPVKLLGRIQGSDGVLQVGPDRIVFKTDRPRQSRTWRYQDIENASTSDRYQLTLTTYERAKTHYGSRKGFNFQLKQPLDEKRFEMLWKRVNQDKGLQFLTSIEERNQTTK
jgi:hypothetical protein